MDMVTQENWVDKQIPISGGWPLNNYRAWNSTDILEGVMAMISRGSVLCGIESVRKVFPWSNWALCNYGHTVHKAIVQHTLSVPVHCSSVI
jgi:hypothetical protein